MLQVPPKALEKLERRPSLAYPITIAEQSGQGRAIVLRGRSLPYRGVGWGQEQRVEIKYFPGNPVGQAQVMGPRWTTTEMNGMWKDAFLYNEDSWAKLINFPKIAQGIQVYDEEGKPAQVQFGGNSFDSGGAITGGPAGKARRARVLRDAMYMIQRAGQLLKVEWGSIVRYGFIKNYTPTHDTEEDIAWSLEFDWIGDTASTPKTIPKPEINTPGLLAQILAAVQEFIDKANAEFAKIYGAVLEATQLIKKLASLANGLINTLGQFFKLVFAPAEVLGTIKEQLASIKGTALALKDQLQRLPQGYQASKAGATTGEQNEAIAAAQAIAFSARKLGVDAAITLGQIEELASPELLGVLTAQQNTTLKDISTDYYGSPTEWPTIAKYNNFASMIVPRGTVVLIPKLQVGLP